jgi:hypothetical protein
LLLRDGLLFVEVAEALEITLGVGQIGLRLRQPSAGLRHLALNVGGSTWNSNCPAFTVCPSLTLRVRI